MTQANPPPETSLPRAVLDTSALFSAHRHWLWLLARLGYYEGVWSTFIVAELVRIRVERSIARGVERSIYRGHINELVHRLSDVLLLADYRAVSTGGALRDPDDEPILATALAARADFVVSLNTRDFAAGGAVLVIRFITPAAFLAERETRHPTVEVPQRAADAGRQLP